MAGRKKGRKLQPTDPDYKPASGIPAGGMGNGNARAEPFGLRNTTAVSHGAHSERLVGPLAEELRGEVEALVQGTPAAGPSFALARATLARRLAQVQLLAAYLEDRGPLESDGEVRSAAKYETELLASVDKALDSLGLTPRSAAALGVDLLRGESLVDEMGEARRIREEAERRHGGGEA